MSEKVTKPGEEGLTKAEIMVKRMESLMKLDPTVTMTIGDTDYKLVVNNRTAKDILKDTGVNLLSAGFTYGQLDDPALLGSVMFRALQKHQPSLTQESVDEMINLRHLLYIKQKAIEVLSLFMPDIADLVEPDGKTDEGEQTTEDPTSPPPAHG